MVDQLKTKKDDGGDRPLSTRSNRDEKRRLVEGKTNRFLVVVDQRRFDPFLGDEKLVWLTLQKTEKNSIRTPSDLEDQLADPPMANLDQDILDRVQGSICGLAIGDALGAHVENT